MREAPEAVWVVMCHDNSPEGGDFFVAVASTADAAKREAATYVGEKSLTWRQLNSMFDHQECWRSQWDDPDGSLLNFSIHEEEVNR